jgi:hypothetical protein
MFLKYSGLLILMVIILKRFLPHQIEEIITELCFVLLFLLSIYITIIDRKNLYISLSIFFFLSVALLIRFELISF